MTVTSAEKLTSQSLKGMIPGKDFDALLFRELGRWAGKFYIPRAVSTCRDDVLWLVDEVYRHCRGVLPPGSAERFLEYVEGLYDPRTLSRVILEFILLDGKVSGRCEESEKLIAARDQSARECLRLAGELEMWSLSLQGYIKVLKGEATDLTGMGLERMVFGHLERILGKKLVDIEPSDAGGPDAAQPK